MDGINDRILQELSRDGRISNLDLAERVGLSPSACLRRVQDLERRGVIAGYRAVLDRAAARGGVHRLCHRRPQFSHTKASQEAFERAMARPGSGGMPQHHRGGRIPAAVEVADLPAYKAFHTEALGTLPQVNAITSYVVMGSPKDARG